MGWGSSTDGKKQVYSISPNCRVMENDFARVYASVTHYVEDGMLRLVNIGMTSMNPKDFRTKHAVHPSGLLERFPRCRHVVYALDNKQLTPVFKAPERAKRAQNQAVPGYTREEAEAALGSPFLSDEEWERQAVGNDSNPLVDGDKIESGTKLMMMRVMGTPQYKLALMSLAGREVWNGACELLRESCLAPSGEDNAICSFVVSEVLRSAPGQESGYEYRTMRVERHTVVSAEAKVDYTFPQEALPTKYLNAALVGHERIVAETQHGTVAVTSFDGDAEAARLGEADVKLVYWLRRWVADMRRRGNAGDEGVYVACQDTDAIKAVLLALADMQDEWPDDWTPPKVYIDLTAPRPISLREEALPQKGPNGEMILPDLPKPLDYRGPEIIDAMCLAHDIRTHFLERMPAVRNPIECWFAWMEVACGSDYVSSLPMLGPKRLMDAFYDFGNLVCDEFVTVNEDEERTLMYDEHAFHAIVALAYMNVVPEYKKRYEWLRAVASRGNIAGAGDKPPMGFGTGDIANFLGSARPRRVTHARQDELDAIEWLDDDEEPPNAKRSRGEADADVSDARKSEEEEQEEGEEEEKEEEGPDAWMLPDSAAHEAAREAILSNMPSLGQIVTAQNRRRADWARARMEWEQKMADEIGKWDTEESIRQSRAGNAEYRRPDRPEALNVMPEGETTVEEMQAAFSARLDVWKKRIADRMPALKDKGWKDKALLKEPLPKMFNKAGKVVPFAIPTQEDIQRRLHVLMLSLRYFRTGDATKVTGMETVDNRPIFGFVRDNAGRVVCSTEIGKIE